MDYLLLLVSVVVFNHSFFMCLRRLKKSLSAKMEAYLAYYSLGFNIVAIMLIMLGLVGVESIFLSVPVIIVGIVTSIVMYVVLYRTPKAKRVS